MEITVPGDKSLSQRALICAALADGQSRLSGLLPGGDAESTAGALRALGASIPEIPNDGSDLVVDGLGLGGLVEPTGELDLGNSGTGARLLMGVLAGSGISATVTGDDSLRSRPMRRIIDPLSALGASFTPLGGKDRLPLLVSGAGAGRHAVSGTLSPASSAGPTGSVVPGAGRARSIDWVSQVASAQVKSSVLFAGLMAGMPVQLTEPRRSRDHTERMLRSMGARVLEHAGEGGWKVELRDPPRRLRSLDVAVPGDPSSAAFVVAAAVLGIAGGGTVTVPRVGMNPLRTAFFDVLARMGARVETEMEDQGADHDDTEASAAEPVGAVVAGPSDLVGVAVGSDEVPRLIDELPLVAVLGARAKGETRISGAEELRAKESDRITALVTNLRGLGVEVEEHPDGLTVLGSSRRLAGRVRAFRDHRIAMAFAVLGAAPGNDVEIDRPELASVSFPGFWRTLARLRRSCSTSGP